MRPGLGSLPFLIYLYTATTTYFWSFGSEQLEDGCFAHVLLRFMRYTILGPFYSTGKSCRYVFKSSLWGRQNATILCWLLTGVNKLGDGKGKERGYIGNEGRVGGRWALILRFGLAGLA
jgi:hypothetical protein